MCGRDRQWVLLCTLHAAGRSLAHCGIRGLCGARRTARSFRRGVGGLHVSWGRWRQVVVVRASGRNIVFARRSSVGLTSPRVYSGFALVCVGAVADESGWVWAEMVCTCCNLGQGFLFIVYAAGWEGEGGS